ncbi:MAG: molybdopterin molybdotransferase MoeA [Planctomycetales bacterium]|nr:molybdopterin molybdotransferase MoeA [Planctomycetales bacterium]
MLSVADAFDLLAQHVAPLPSADTPLSDLLNHRLAVDVVSGVDSPPFDKSMVDGYAISLADDSTELAVLEQVIAGGVPTQPLAPGGTIRVMTGAPVPHGTDAVVKWEDCRELAPDRIANPATGVAPGHCVLKCGTAFRRGETVLPAGKRLTPLDIALLAEIGQARVAAVPLPRAGVLPTGNELVAPDQPVGPGQIRNSNGPMLLASLAAAGVPAVDLGVARDELAALQAAVQRGLAECDVLLISGGVSAGVMDLVPGVLAELGVREVFHKLKMKPGKPLWFGVRDGDARRQYVFGLPGNPVSTLVSFRLFVLPTLATLAGAPFAPPATRRGVLATTYAHRGGRPTYHPCRLVERDGMLPQIEPLAWRGSADLATLTRADCLGVFPAGDYELAAGTEADALPL